MTRGRSTVLLAFAAALSAAPLARPAGQVIGGTTIQVQAAPWAVFVRQTTATGSLQCSGTIIDALHVVTAAHCVHNLSGQEASITSLSVRAGISSYTSPAAGDAEQDRGVSSLRVHPGYVWSTGASPDDVAVLALSDPLDLSGPAVQAVALPNPGAPLPPHSAVALAGFGREVATSSPNGSLNWWAATTGDPDNCGGYANTVIPDADAVAVCASSPTGAVCTGDSGSGLVTTTGVPTLVGVTSAGPPGCSVAGSGVFTYVPAPEILDFIQGNDTPPTAPRRTSDTTVKISWKTRLAVGTTITCASGGWTGAPTLTYAFLDSQDDSVVQQGPRPTYTLTPADVGRSLYCRVLATNAGGTAALRTVDTGAVAPAPRVGITTVAPRNVARGRTALVKVVIHAGAGLSGKFGVCITPPVRIAHRVCSSQMIDEGSYGGFPFTLGVRIKPTAPRGPASLSIAVVAGVSRAESTAVVRIT